MFEGDDASSDPARAVFTRRAAAVGLLQVVGLGVLTARLYQLQVRDQRQYGELADANRTTRQTLAPLRGRIYDRYGALLADTEEFYQALLTPSLADDVERVFAVLNRIKPISDDDRARLRQLIKTQSPNEPVVVAKALSWKELSAININAPLLPGVHTEIGGRRTYKHGNTMGRIIGYIGGVERFALDDDPIVRLPRARIGKAGIELGMDSRLRGAGGAIVREVDARGQIIRNLAQTDPKRGSDIAVTVDRELQRRLLKRLSAYRRASGVVLDVATGDVVAMASWPMFNSSRLAEPITREEWAKVRKAQDDPLIDRSIQGLYPPGSTFKMVTALAALEAGVIGRFDQVTCGGTYVLAGSKFRCWNRGGHGACNLHRALRESCDVYFYEVARRVGIERLAAMARRLGLGQAFATGIDPVRGGLIPDPEWKRGRFGKAWFGGETLHAGIGQGYVLTTPLQLAVMTARIASGKSLTPTVVRPRVPGNDAEVAALGIKASHLAAVRRGMWAVVNEGGGTGKNARLNDARLKIYGKTGTSQVARISSRVARHNLRWGLRDHALFVGYVADQLPRYAVAAIVEHGGSGGKVAAPLVRAIVEDTIAVDPAARPVFDVRPGARLRED
ncbi:MAG: penicillin-binding protein 2 [Hyphomicrobiaceae bacterium]